MMRKEKERRIDASEMYVECFLILLTKNFEYKEKNETQNLFVDH
jgi:hypothetical protein